MHTCIQFSIRANLSITKATSSLSDVIKTKWALMVYRQTYLSSKNYLRKPEPRKAKERLTISKTIANNPLISALQIHRLFILT